jgi:hypothetical protein
MASSTEKLAECPEVLSGLQEKGIVAIRSVTLSLAHKEK